MSSLESSNGITSSARECRMTVFGLTVVTVPQFFHAGHSKTKGVSPLCMFTATAPPREEPTITSGLCWSYSAWAVRAAAAKSSSSRAGLMTEWPWVLTPRFKPAKVIKMIREVVVPLARNAVRRFATGKLSNLLSERMTLRWTVSIFDG